MFLLHETDTNAIALAATLLLHTALLSVGSVISKLLVKIGMNSHIIGYRILHASYRIWIFWSRGCLLRNGLSGKKNFGFGSLRAFFVCEFFFFLILKFTLGIDRKVLAIDFYFIYSVLCKSVLDFYCHIP